MGYNPADYRATQDEAKDMSKADLEEYYVKDRGKRHLRCCDVIGITFMVGIFVLLFVAVGMILQEDIIESRVSDALVETSFEVCPTLGEGYSSERFITSSYLTERIVCAKFNSNP